MSVYKEGSRDKMMIEVPESTSARNCGHVDDLVARTYEALRCLRAEGFLVELFEISEPNLCAFRIFASPKFDESNPHYLREIGQAHPGGASE